MLSGSEPLSTLTDTIGCVHMFVLIHTSRFPCEGCFKESGAPGDVTGEAETRAVEEIILRYNMFVFMRSLIENGVYYRHGTLYVSYAFSK